MPGFALPELHQLQLVLLGLLRLTGRQVDSLLQASGGLREIALELPGGAEIGDDSEMVGMVVLGGPQHLDGFCRLTEANVQCTQVGQLIRAQLPFAASLFQLPQGFFVPKLVADWAA